MNESNLITVALDPTQILIAQGMTPDPWQREFLFSTAPAILLNCSRGAGKSRTTSALALHTALFKPKSLVLLISRSQRQSGELFRYVKQGCRALNHPLNLLKETETQLEFQNGSRIVSLPGHEETIRSFQGVNLLVLDEAARIPDDLYASVSPMTGVVKGRTICLSTPFGQRGWWWREWHNEQAGWQRFLVPWQRCPRLSADFIAEERRKFGDSWIAQEYECSFISMEGLVYPNFYEQSQRPDCYGWTAPPIKRVGGIDFGFRNPFAAVWGHVGRAEPAGSGDPRQAQDVLFVDGELYVTETPLSELMHRLPRGILWTADPAGAGDIALLKRADFKVQRAMTDIRAGIAAVTARLQTGRLFVNEERCPNLLAEARLYRYPTASDAGGISEVPIAQDNHALDALRYLVSRLDNRFLQKHNRTDDANSADESARRSLWNRPEVWTPL